MSDDSNEPEPTELPSTEAGTSPRDGHEQIGTYNEITTSPVNAGKIQNSFFMIILVRGGGEQSLACPNVH